jgi:hypothetical protein
VVNRYRWRLWAPLSGIGAAALFIIAFAIAGDAGSESQEIADFFADSGNRSQVMVAWFLFAAGILMLIWFLWSLRARLMAAEGGIPGLATLAFAAGMASVPLWFVANSAFAAPAVDYDASEFDPDAAQLLAALGFGAFVGAQMVFAVTLFATAALALRTRVFPMWFAWATLVVGLIMFVGIAFGLPFFFFLAWLIAAGVLMMWQTWVEMGGRRPRPTAGL